MATNPDNIYNRISDITPRSKKYTLKTVVDTAKNLGYNILDYETGDFFITSRFLLGDSKDDKAQKICITLENSLCESDILRMNYIRITRKMPQILILRNKDIKDYDKEMKKFVEEATNNSIHIIPCKPGYFSKEDKKFEENLRSALGQLLWDKEVK